MTTVDFNALDSIFQQMFSQLPDGNLIALRDNWDEVVDCALTNLRFEIASRNTAPVEDDEPFQMIIPPEAPEPVYPTKEMSGFARLLLWLAAGTGAFLLCRGIYFVLMTQ